MIAVKNDLGAYTDDVKMPRFCSERVLDFVRPISEATGNTVVDRETSRGHGSKKRVANLWTEFPAHNR